MANFKLNSVLVATESGGTVTLDSGTVVPAAGVTGTLPNAVQDNITRLGTVTAGTIECDINSGISQHISTLHSDNNSSPTTSSAKGVSGGSNDRSVGYDTTWVDHLRSEHFTTTSKSNIISYTTFGHGYESGAVRAQCALRLYTVTGSSSFTYADVSSTYGDGTPSGIQENFKQGHTVNLSHGQVAMWYAFRNVPAGKYIVICVVRNLGVGSTAKWNMFVSQDDKMNIFYKG